MPFSRRTFLVSATTLTAAALVPLPRVLAQQGPADYPFALGVASGYPQSDGVVLWTRLAPRPLEGGGMPRRPVEVAWEVAADEAFRNSVRRGTAVAAPELAHSVHVEVAGLEPARWYWYRFHAGQATSPAGRTRTAPVADTAVERMRFAFACCQQYEQGYYAAYRHMAAEDLDLVIHLGDYIYESSWGRNHVRKHEAGEPITLEEYRNRHALYKTDPDLQAAHASFPWLVTWDDHEVDNDYADRFSEDRMPPELFLKRRAAAYQAYYEHMPLPAWARPRGPDMRLYTRWDFGQLAQFHVLDDRQYRSPQVCPRPGRGGSNVVEDCRERLEPQRTLLGAAQERWLFDGLAASPARWNVIAQQTLMAQVDRTPGEGQSFWSDGWDGYPLARRRLLAHIAEQRIANPVVIGGDVHMSVVADLKTDFDEPRAPVVATEFVATSISSQGRPRREIEAWAPDNPHVKYANPTRRGYTVMELSARRCVAHLRTLDDVKDPQSRIRTLIAFAAEEGRPGAQRFY
ncbi:MAG: alkaline phosphatase [Betaproteobacteria bacterium RIFCSPLOWO2_12_FULL_62_13]|nr:MAG: alkaline phosphatase [Betaproteobacteria bacterium RIFCSPLOWO2_12_FULL_62_13]